MTLQTSDVRGRLSALSTVIEYLRGHVFDGSFDKFGIGFEATARDRLKNIASLLALAPRETVFVTVQNRLKGRDGDQGYGTLAVMEKPDDDDDNMIDLCRPYIDPDLHAGHVAIISTFSRGRHQHVEIIESLLLAIHLSWNENKNLQTNQRCDELCEVFVSYTLGTTSTEFRYRLEFGREESAFIEFFDGSPPTIETFNLADAGIDKYDAHGERSGVLDEWTKLSHRLRDEVDSFEEDMKMSQDELDDDFQEFARIQAIPGNAYITVANGFISTKVIALVHIVIRFRLGRIVKALEVLDNGTMQAPWHTTALITPPPHTLQKELHTTVTNLTGLLLAYRRFLYDSDPNCKCYTLPNVFPIKRSSNLSLEDDIQQTQFEKSRTDDVKYDYFRNLPFGSSMVAWLHGLCYHYHSAQGLIRFVKKVSKDELEKSRIVLKLLPKVPEVATEGIEMDLVLTAAMEAPKADDKVQEKYDQIADILSKFAYDEEDFALCVADGFLSTESLAPRFFFEMMSSIVHPTERKDMEPVPREESYKRKLYSHIHQTYPKIACNRAISMVSAILLDELLTEYYGDIVYQKGVSHEHGIISGLKCWNKIFATAVPAEVKLQVAERVIVKLRRDFRRRMSSMRVESLKHWIAFAMGDVDEMPGVELGDEQAVDGDVEMS
ncbi:hypothetical protein E2P81_ATG02150 [Venturia nashicola]|nr:hypothetical protein E2P81_ATG02150 [Venturia nashicola]